MKLVFSLSRFLTLKISTKKSLSLEEIYVKVLTKNSLNMWKNNKIQVIIRYELIKNRSKYDNNGNDFHSP